MAATMSISTDQIPPAPVTQMSPSRQGCSSPSQRSPRNSPSVFRNSNLFKDAFVNMIFGEDASGHEKLTETLVANKTLLSTDDQYLIRQLLDLEQSHLFESWERLGVNDDKKRQMMADLHALENSYPGGLKAYIEKARGMLAASASGANSLDGWTPSVPTGMHLDPVADPQQYEIMETLGERELAKCVFVLVAGGLGERLGYSDIKIGLPVDTLTRKTYLELYLDFLKAYGNCPLVIMTSEDTHDRTVKLLAGNQNFHFPSNRITLLKQGKVPALLDQSAKIAVEGRYSVLAKPHGHGDVHKLIFESGQVAEWTYHRREWLVFLQDTNGLGLLSLPAMLGVSKKLNLAVNSACVPRKPKQEIGAITTLTAKAEGLAAIFSSKTMTVNVEYNQLEPLLRATTSPAGDTADPVTGHSPFPGNINQLIFRLETYAQTLAKSQGIMPEFVNPKYADEARTAFAKPTRLECRMQDFPKLLPPSATVGFTRMPAWLCFSPCKNSIQAAAAAAAKGGPAASAASAEADQYEAYRTLLRVVGCNVEDGEVENYAGVPAMLKPSISIAPSFAYSLRMLKTRFPTPEHVHIRKNAGVILDGDTTISRMSIDGMAEFSPAMGKLEVQNFTMQNSGHRFTKIAQGKGHPEMNLIRGYKCEVLVNQESYKFSHGPINTNILAHDGGCGGCKVM